MYCKNCGTEFEGKFCPKCGSPGLDGASIPSGPAAATTTTTHTAKSYRTTVKALLVVGLICFFFPFATISCMDESADLAGIDLLVGPLDSEDEATYEDEYGAIADEVYNDFGPNFPLVIAFACGLVGFGFAWKRSMKIPAVASAIGAVSLLVFRFSFYSTYFSEYGKELMSDCVKFRWGWWVSLLTYLLAAVTAFISLNPQASNAENKIS